MIVRDSLTYLVGRYGAAFVTMLTVFVFTRLAAPAEYGRYALTVSTAFVVYCVTLQWLRLAMGRYVPGAGEDSDRFLTQMLLCGGGILLAATGVALVVLPFLPATEKLLFIAGVILFLAFGSAEVLVGVFQAWLQPVVYSLLGFARVAAGLAVGASLSVAGFGAIGLVIGAALGHLLVTAIALSLILPRLRLTHFDGAATLVLARFGVVLAIGASLGAAMAFSDRYLVASLIGVEAAGAYSAASDLSARSLLIVISAISLAGAPRIFRAYDAGGLKVAQPLLERQAQVLMIVGAPAAALLILFAPAVVTLMLGGQYRAAALEVMPWIVAGAFMQGIRTAYFEYAFSLTKRLWRQAGVLLAAMLAGVAVNVLLIQVAGLKGAAIAFMLSNLLALAGAVVLGRRELALPLPLRDLAKTIAGCLVMTLVCWPYADEISPLAVMTVSLAGGLAYCAVLYLLDAAALRPAAKSLLKRLQRAVTHGAVRPAG